MKGKERDMETSGQDGIMRGCTVHTTHTSAGALANMIKDSRLSQGDTNLHASKEKLEVSNKQRAWGSLRAFTSKEAPISSPQRKNTKRDNSVDLTLDPDPVFEDAMFGDSDQESWQS
jgi:hypothetical protein